MLASGLVPMHTGDTESPVRPSCLRSAVTAALSFPATFSDFRENPSNLSQRRTAILGCQGSSVKFRSTTSCAKLRSDLHKPGGEWSVAGYAGCENLPGRTLTTQRRLRSTPRRGLKSYLKFALRFIGVSEDADAVQGA